MPGLVIGGVCFILPAALRGSSAAPRSSIVPTLIIAPVSALVLLRSSLNAAWLIAAAALAEAIVAR